jgi:hypothetical protein
MRSYAYLHVGLVRISTWVSRLLAELASLNAPLRVQFREGMDLWVVYNEDWQTERTRALGAPLEPWSVGRALMVKYTRTIIR